MCVNDNSFVCVQVCEWWKVCGHLEKSLPPDDPVLGQWRESVELMHSDMPILKLLASPALQVCMCVPPDVCMACIIHVHVQVYVPYMNVFCFLCRPHIGTPSLQPSMSSMTLPRATPSTTSLREISASSGTSSQRSTV